MPRVPQGQSGWIGMFGHGLALLCMCGRSHQSSRRLVEEWGLCDDAPLLQPASQPASRRTNPIQRPDTFDPSTRLHFCLGIGLVKTDPPHESGEDGVTRWGIYLFPPHFLDPFLGCPCQRQLLPRLPPTPFGALHSLPLAIYKYY